MSRGFTWRRGFTCRRRGFTYGSSGVHMSHSGFHSLRSGFHMFCSVLAKSQKPHCRKAQHEEIDARKCRPTILTYDTFLRSKSNEQPKTAGCSSASQSEKSVVSSYPKQSCPKMLPVRKLRVSEEGCVHPRERWRSIPNPYQILFFGRARRVCYPCKTSSHVQEEKHA